MSGAAAARLGSLLDALTAAVGFLTIVPVPEVRAERAHERATALFPWVGAALGALAAVVAALPLEPLVSGGLAVALLFASTGGLHWDGWADVLDATLTPGVGRQRRTAILADPRVGANAAFGVAVLVVVAAVAAAQAPAWGIVLGCASGRTVMVATLAAAPPLRSTGAAARLAGRARPVGAMLGLLSIGAGAVASGAAPGRALLALGSGITVAVLFAAFLVRRLGGMNGDAHGATGLLAETTVWLVSAGWSGAQP